MIKINENKKTMISLVTSLIAMALSIIINFFLSPYIVKNFGEEANGFTQLANNFVNYATLITVALNSMAGRFITISYYNRKYDECDKYYSSVIIGNAFIFALLIIPATICVFKLESIVNIETANVNHVKLLFAFVFANFFISQVNSVIGVVFYVKNEQYLQNSINALRYLMNAGGLLILFSVFVPKIYFVSLMGVILSLLTFPCYFIIKLKTMPEVKFSFKYFDFKSIWKMISSGLWNTLNQCGNLLMTGFDLLLANLLLGPSPMGILSVAKTIPNCIIQLGATVNTTFSPNLTIAYASGDNEQILKSLRYSMKCSSFLMSIPLMVLCVFGIRFYKLWVPSLDAVQLTVLSIVTCSAFILFAGPQTLYNVYTTTNKLKVNSLSVVVGGILNIIIVWILVKFTSLGLYAIAGVSALISIIRNLIITVPYTAKLLGLRWYTFYKDVLISLACCVLSAGACFLMDILIKPNSWITMFVSVGIACVISAILIFAILLNKEEKKKFMQRFKKGE